MPSINMIAPRRAERKRLERDARRLMLLICVQLIVGLALTGLLWLRVYNTYARIGDLEVQLVKLQPDVRRIQTLQQETKYLEPKLMVLNEAKGRTIRWHNMLDKLGTSMPEKTWIQRISSTPPAPDKSQIQLVLTGVSESNRLVGDMMLRMYSNSDLDDVALRFTQTTDLADRSLYEFEVAASMKTGIRNEQKEVTADGAERS